MELSSDVPSKSGMRFNNRYGWICRFAGEMIVEVRAYLDSAMIGELFRKNPLCSPMPILRRPAASIPGLTGSRIECQPCGGASAAAPDPAHPSRRSFASEPAFERSTKETPHAAVPSPRDSGG